MSELKMQAVLPDQLRYDLVLTDQYKKVVTVP